jgi:acyl-CoA thioesterase-1
MAYCLIDRATSPRWLAPRRQHRCISSSLRRMFIIALSLTLAFPAEIAAARTPVILVFGDSFTAGLGLSRQAAFPAQLEARLIADGLRSKVINAGVSGDTTAGGLTRLDQALLNRPDFVILELGANDALRGIQPATVRNNLDAIITKAKASGAKILLTGMRAPPNWGVNYRNAFDWIYPDLARAQHVPLYPFFLQGVALNSSLNQPDSLHPNSRGVAILVDRIAPIVVQLLRNPM